MLKYLFRFLVKYSCYNGLLLKKKQNYRNWRWEWKTLITYNERSISLFTLQFAVSEGITFLDLEMFD